MLAGARHWLHFVAGGLLLKSGRVPRAARVLARAVELNPDHAMSHSSLAIALLKMGRWEDAAAGFSAALELEPGAVEWRANFIVAMLHLSRWDEAVLACQRAIERDPGRAILHEHLGIALVKLDRWKEAADVLRRAVDLNPRSAEAASLWHLALMKQERWEEALDALREVIARQPASAQHHRGLGVILARLERWDEAAAAFQQALALEPGHPESYHHLASFLANTRASEGSVAVDRRALERNPDNAAALLRLGVGLSAVGRSDEAVAVLERGCALAPPQAEQTFQYLLVDPLTRVGRRADALAAYRRARKKGGDRPRLPGEAPLKRLEKRQASFWSREKLGEEVFGIERWLEGLGSQSDTAPSAAAGGPRLLFLLDADFGELTTLMYLLLGRPLMAGSSLLLPERLFEKNPDALKGRTYRYKSVEDVFQAVDRLKPDAVLLCSGYLLAVHGLFSIAELERLVHGLRERGCRVVTADPFLGMFSQRPPREIVSISIPERSDDDEQRKRLIKLKGTEEERLWTNFTASERILRDCWHLYPSYCDVPPGEFAATDHRNLSFFNPRLVSPELPAATPAANGRPYWFFVMSQTDYEAQQLFESQPVFLDLVVEKLLETLAAGRRPILIAPREMIGSLQSRMPTLEDVELLSYCPFNQYTSLLLGAEYAFYWNVLSHSIMIRMFNRRPTIVFDRGHLIRNVPAMYPRVIQWYYQGWEPKLFDHRQPLTLESVAAWAEPYRQAADDICRRFQRGATPEDMVAQALNGEPPAVGPRSNGS